MRTFSIYRYVNSSLETVQSVISDYKVWNEVVKDPVTSEELEFSYEKNEEIELDFNDSIVRCLYISFKNEKLSNKHRHNTDKNKRIRRNDSDIILFEEGEDLIVVPLRGKNSTTGSLLRTALNIQGDGSLVDCSFDIKEDFFYWIFNRYLNLKNINVDKGKKITINSLTGFTGETRDSVNKIDGKGSRVSKILWTLAFLFTNESLKSITPELTHIRLSKGAEVREVIKLELTLNGTYKIDESTHLGTQLLNKHTEKKISYLLIYVYKILIPELQALYDSDIHNKIWSPYIKMQFISGIGSEIQDQVEDILLEIDKELGGIGE